jgi:hypothetical protein
MSSPAFVAAAARLIQFGKYRGKSIDDIARTEDGLKYLDWLRDQPWITVAVREDIELYLKDPSIARDLDQATD